MPVPKRKRSRTRRDKRFANKGVVVIEAAVCPTCQEPRSSHQVCMSCGHYKGVKVMKTKADRMLKRGAQRQAKQARKTPSGTSTEQETKE